MTINLGAASGKLSIDVTGVAEAANKVKDYSAKMIVDLGATGAAADRTDAQLIKLYTNASLGAAKLEAAMEKNAQAAIIGQAKTELALAKVESGLKRVKDQSEETGLSLAATLGRVSNVLSHFTMAFLTVAKAGIETSTSIETVNRRFLALTGNQEKAKDLMLAISAQAKRFGQSTIEAQEGLLGLVPSLKGGAKELEVYTNLAFRLASINPQQGIAGAVRAIGELVSGGKVTSLVERFNLDRGLVRNALNATGNDYAKSLDIVLNKIGATDKAAEAAGKTFNASGVVLGEAFNRAASTGLKPFLDILTQIFFKLSEFLDGIRETNPVILNIVAGVGILVTAFSSLAVVITQVLALANTLKALNLASTFKGIGLASVAVGLGAGAGFKGAQFLADAGVIKDERLKSNSGVDPTEVFMEVIKKTMFVLYSVMTDFGTSIGKLVVVVQNSGELLSTAFKIVIDKVSIAFFGLIDTIGSLVLGIAKIIPDFLPDMKKQISAFGEGLQSTGATGSKNANASLNENTDKYFLLLDKFKSTVMNVFGNDTEIDQAARKRKQEFFDSLFPSTKTPNYSSKAGSLQEQAPHLFSDEQIDKFNKFQEDKAKIQDDADQKALEQQKSFEEEKAQNQAKYDLKRLQDEEDETLRRSRARAKRDRDIEEIQTKGIAREQELAVNHAEKLQELQTTRAEDEAKSLVEHNKNLADLDKKSRESILDAARNLDAEGIRKALANRTEGLNQENEKFTDNNSKIKDNYTKKLTEENAAYAKSLEAGRTADAEKIEQLKANFKIDEDIRQADWQTKRDRERAQHDAEVAQADKENIDKLNKIRTQAEREIETKRIAFIREFNQLNAHQNNLLALQETYYKRSEAQLLSMINSVTSVLSTASGGTLTESFNNPLGTSGSNFTPIFNSNITGQKTIQRFAGGSTGLQKDGLFYGEKDERILTSSANRAISQLLGNDYTSNQLVGALAGANRTGNALSIGQFAPQIVIQDAGSYSKEQLYEIVGNSLLGHLEDAKAKLGGRSG